MSTSRQTQSTALVVLLALGTVFGAAFLFMKVLVAEIGTTEIVAGRLFLGALTVLAVMAVRGIAPRLSPSIVGKVSMLALLDTVVPYTLVAWAEVHIDSGAASTMISTMPLFTTLFAAVALPEERLASAQLLAMPLGFVGVVVLAGGDALHLTSGDTLGRLAVVGAAASYGAAAVYARVLLRTQDALSLTGLKLGLGALMALPLVAAAEGVPGYAALSLKGWLALLALGVASTGVAFIAYFWILNRAGSIYASLVTYVVPVSGLLLGWAVLGEQIGASTVLGTGLIALSVAGVMYGPALRRQAGSLIPRVPRRRQPCAEAWAVRGRPALAEARVPVADDCA